jgi:DNA-binding beta-propeller fold protein YncE
MKTIPLFLFVAGLLGAVQPGFAHSTTRLPLPGDGTWDYLTADVPARRLYVSHATRVHVVDLDSLQLLGEIAPTPGVHGVALDAERGRGYTSNGTAATVTVFDPATRRILRTLKVEGTKPDAILYEPFSRRVFTFNGESDNTTAFDTASGATAGSLDLGGAPEFAVSNRAGSVYVNLEDKAEVVRFDPVALKITARWPLAPGDTPTALALDPANHRLFSGCRSKHLLVLDSDTGAIIAHLPIGGGVDAIALDPDHPRAFVSNGDGTVNIITWTDATHYRVAETIRTQPGAKTLAYDPVKQRLFLSAAKLGRAPSPTPADPKPRAPILPGTFGLLVINLDPPAQP